MVEGGRRLRATRRAALVSGLSAGLVPFLPPGVAGREADALASLGALLDTLLPDDGLSPAATAVGVDVEIRALLETDPRLFQFFGAALSWLDGLADRPLRDLDPATRHDIVSALAASDVYQIPGRFYHIVRALAVEVYFARPEALAGLPLYPAPQPQGYPPPWG